MNCNRRLIGTEYQCLGITYRRRHSALRRKGVVS
ncbi:unnamed protein product [Medioppia subpectinata]|uniref:Uncharacterized protein n=1 Tax=Medioppia subpectinata TaxID=1979941 RepID=A0A7R9Q734_9ACAR|nr:unnamed protein product [Medioppia subpectinata]CAG2114384.1 unnamed protein product [Medioppia subpectinata]